MTKSSLADNGKTVTLKTGESFRVKLSSNPSTGYGWQMTESDREIVRHTHTAYDSDCPENEHMEGCASYETWIFAASSPGNTPLEMSYRRSWEDSALETFTLNVSVIGDPLTRPEDPLNPVDILSEADYDHDGVAEREDMVEKRRDVKREFRTWKRECWRTKSDCGDHDGNGRVDRKDLIGKRKEMDEAFQAWKKASWCPAMEVEANKGLNLGRNAEISACGGFEAESAAADLLDAGDDCKDERLVWEYDAAMKTATFLNQNVWLNCCGNHAVSVTLDKEGYEIRETDTPEMDGDIPLRCDCMCLFDFKVELPDVEPGLLEITLTRHVTDTSGPVQTIWAGELDMSQGGQGDELIREDVGWCYGGN